MASGKGIKGYCLIILTIAFLKSNIAFGSLDKLIKNAMPEGTMYNSTRGAVIKGQEAGHLIGGSIMLKSPTPEQLQLINIEPPRCRLGGLPCAAQIDIRAGGLSFVTSGELMNFLKKIPQAAPAYAGMLLVKSVSPQLEDLMSYLRDVAAEANKLAIDQCSAMEALTNASLSMLNAGSKATRQSAMLFNQRGKDMSAIGEASLSDSDDSKNGAEEELKSLLGDNYNLVWKALEKKSIAASGGSEFRELLMSISGTIIGTKQNNISSVVHKSSLVNKELIKDFIGNSETTSKLKLYRCDSAFDCLHPEIADAQNISADDSLMGRVSKLLKSIAVKIHNDSGDLSFERGFTAEEEALISLSRIPIIRKIEMDLSIYKDPDYAVYAQGEFVEALCYDVVTTYLSSLLHEVDLAVSEMSRQQLTDRSIFDDFKKNTSQVMRLLENTKSESFRRYSAIEQSKALLRQTENDFERKFEEFISNSH